MHVVLKREPLATIVIFRGVGAHIANSSGGSPILGPDAGTRAAGVHAARRTNAAIKRLADTP